MRHYDAAGYIDKELDDVVVGLQTTKPLQVCTVSQPAIQCVTCVTRTL